MKRPFRLLSITGSLILALSCAGMALSPPAAQAATESICAYGNSYCWSQPDTNNPIRMTKTTNIASFTPENCQPIKWPLSGEDPASVEACQLVAVDGACVRAQYGDAPVLLWGCGGSSEYTEYWYRLSGCGGLYYWVNVGDTINVGVGDNNYQVAYADVGQNQEVYMQDDEFCELGGPENNQWIFG
jgi:hypothetical protein